MIKKQGKGNIIVFLFLLIMLGVSSYFLYLTITDLYAENIPLKILQEIKPVSRNQSSFSGEFQFYPNMRFQKKEISYSIDASCNEEKITRINQAIREIEQETNLLQFKQESNSKILFSCSETEPQIKEKYFIVGEGGPVKIVNTSLFYVIEEGKVLLFYKNSVCNNHNVELHELLHVLGFKHSENRESIMYPTTYCNQVLTNDIIEELKRIYSIPSLPDLYFSDVSATKHGSYLDFEITAKNQGLENAESVYLELYSDDKKITEFSLETIKYGEGRILKAKDVSIPRKTSQIKFSISYNSEELDKENNIISLYPPSS